MTGSRSPRLLSVICAGLALAAAALWGAAALPWLLVEAPGRPGVEVTGAVLAPASGGIALVALAGIAGVVATAGPVRRVLGWLLAASAAVVVPAVVAAFSADPLAGVAPENLPGLGGDPVPAVEPTGAPLLAVAAAAVLVLAGVTVGLREHRLPRLGARYGASARARAGQDPDRQAWQDLDEGRDPTAHIDHGTDPEADPGRGDDS
jgi:hypothetical protein